MVDEAFFEEQSEPSKIKAEIVSKYFDAWSNVMTGHARKNQGKTSGRIAYIDLFAGKGRFEDGSPSTPILVLTKAIENPKLRECLITIFNDKDPDIVKSLKSTVQDLPGIKQLKYEPRIYNDEVGTDIAKTFEEMKLVPTLLFIDPWGYKGISQRLINSVLKHFGCDCILFFNYNRVNAALDNPKFVKHMTAIFGQDRAENLRKELVPMTKQEREATIIDELCKALKEPGERFVLPFCFKNETGKRTSHHLLLVSKHILAYEIMKDIMAKYSSSDEQGVPSFMYTPPTNDRQLVLNGLSSSLDGLPAMLLETFAGQSLRVQEIYRQHHIDRPFVKNNYKQVLNELEAAGRVTIDPPAEKRPMRNRVRTLADKSIVTFPEKMV